MVSKLVNKLGVTKQELFEMADVSPENTGGTASNFYPVSIDQPVEFLAGGAAGWSAAEFQDLQQPCKIYTGASEMP